MKKSDVSNGLKRTWKRLLVLSSVVVSQRQAARKYSMPPSNPAKLITGKTFICAKRGKTRLDFGAELENKLVDYASNRAELSVLAVLVIQY